MNAEIIDVLQGEHTRFKLTVDDRMWYELWGVQETARVSIGDLQGIDCLDLFALGFANWDDEIMLVPLWALGLISIGEQLTSIIGERVVVGHDLIDTDTRGGCLAYGFEHAGLKETKNAAT
jgi:hypothetical protein